VPFFEPFRHVECTLRTPESESNSRSCANNVPSDDVHRKKAKGCKEIHHRIEPCRPACRHLSHVTARVAKVRANATLSGNRQQFGGVVEAVDIVSRFGEQVRVPSLSARNIENAGLHWKSKQF
jgi:hypothetical protein